MAAAATWVAAGACDVAGACIAAGRITPGNSTVLLLEKFATNADRSCGSCTAAEDWADNVEVDDAEVAMEGRDARRLDSLALEPPSDEESFETESRLVGDAGCSSPEQRSSASIQSCRSTKTKNEKRVWGWSVVAAGKKNNHAAPAFAALKTNSRSLSF